MYNNVQKDYNKNESFSEKVQREQKKIKMKYKFFNYSPSEFAFGYEGCKRCYFEKKVNGIELRTAFPAIFSKIDSVQKNYYHGKSSKLVSKNLEEGEIISDYNKMLKSEIIYDLKNRPFTMTGKIDAYIKHKNSFTVVDFKTTHINEKKIATYTTQLQSYALMMERPKEGSLKLNPIKKLGILCFEPANISEAKEEDCSMKMDTKWFEIKRDDDALIEYITKIQDILYDKKLPESDSKCGVCTFREVVQNDK